LFWLPFGGGFAFSFPLDFVPQFSLCGGEFPFPLDFVSLRGGEFPFPLDFVPQFSLCGGLDGGCFGFPLELEFPQESGEGFVQFDLLDLRPTDFALHDFPLLFPVLAELVEAFPQLSDPAVVEASLQLSDFVLPDEIPQVCGPVLVVASLHDSVELLLELYSGKVVSALLHDTELVIS